MRALEHQPANDDEVERVLIIDLDDTGSRVTRAASLSPDWQVLSADVGGAPTLRDGDGGGGVMLRIEGVGVGAGKGKGKAQEKREMSGAGGEWGRGKRGAGEEGDEEDRQEEEEEVVDIDIESERMRALIVEFERRMDVLRRVVEGTGTGAAKIGIAEGGDEEEVGEEKGEEE